MIALFKWPLTSQTGLVKGFFFNAELFAFKLLFLPTRIDDDELVRLRTKDIFIWKKIFFYLIIY